MKIVITDQTVEWGGDGLYMHTTVEVDGEEKEVTYTLYRDDDIQEHLEFVGLDFQEDDEITEQQLKELNDGEEV